jgi:hypothetical protein
MGGFPRNSSTATPFSLAQFRSRIKQDLHAVRYEFEANHPFCEFA